MAAAVQSSFERLECNFGFRHGGSGFCPAFDAAQFGFGPYDFQHGLIERLLLQGRFVMQLADEGLFFQQRDLQPSDFGFLGFPLILQLPQLLPRLIRQAFLLSQTGDLRLARKRV